MRNVVIWHWFIKKLLGIWRRNDVDATSLHRIDVITTSCACWNLALPCPPPQYSKPWPPNILNLPTPMKMELFVFTMHKWAARRRWTGKQYRPWSACSSKTLIWIFTVCSDRSVSILRIFTVYACNYNVQYTTSHTLWILYCIQSKTFN